MEEQRQRSLLAGLKYQHLVAGLLGGVASTLATHPFDLIKLRFAGSSTRVHCTHSHTHTHTHALVLWVTVDDGRQLQGRTQYRGLCHATWVILREEGARNGLYRVSARPCHPPAHYSACVCVCVVCRELQPM